ncbi:hypothetical protein PTI98_011407 [Pleurotus ostreatus]|nr:hypothetical protein PTI98_011407 [Pleurotus ostreatus]
MYQVSPGHKDASPAWAHQHPIYNASGYPEQPLSKQGQGVQPFEPLGSHEMRKPKPFPQNHGMEPGMAATGPWNESMRPQRKPKYQAQLYQSTYGREPGLGAADSRRKQVYDEGLNRDGTLARLRGMIASLEAENERIMQEQQYNEERRLSHRLLQLEAGNWYLRRDRGY